VETSIASQAIAAPPGIPGISADEGAQAVAIPAITDPAGITVMDTDTQEADTQVQVGSQSSTSCFSPSTACTSPICSGT
jgi:hypothetical protein